MRSCVRSKAPGEGSGRTQPAKRESMASLRCREIVERTEIPWRPCTYSRWREARVQRVRPKRTEPDVERAAACRVAPGHRAVKLWHGAAAAQCRWGQKTLSFSKDQRSLR